MVWVKSSQGLASWCSSKNAQSCSGYMADCVFQHSKLCTEVPAISACALGLEWQLKTQMLVNSCNVFIPVASFLYYNFLPGQVLMQAFWQRAAELSYLIHVSCSILTPFRKSNTLYESWFSSTLSNSSKSLIPQVSHNFPSNASRSPYFWEGLDLSSSFLCPLFPENLMWSPEWGWSISIVNVYWAKHPLCSGDCVKFDLRVPESFKCITWAENHEQIQKVHSVF